GDGTGAALRRPTCALAGNSALWCGLRNFLGRTWHLASRVIRTDKISSLDGQARVSELDYSGTLALSGCASDRRKRVQYDHLRIDGAGADQCDADRRALVAVPKAVYRWLRTVASVGLFCSLCAALREMARPNNVRANIPMAKRMRIMVAIAPVKITMSSAE